MKILCVDDDPGVLEMVKAVLESEKHEILAAAGGAQGLELFRQHGKTLGGVFLDLRMPGLTGLDLIREIRKTSTVPVVAVSAYLDKVTIGECEKAGFTGFIHKPFDVNQLLSVASNLFGGNAKNR